MLGVCYYPEQWGREKVKEDLSRMKDLGLQFVRIGEFAWSRIEPHPGLFDWEWLDEVLDTAESLGLKIVLGTPTATPPKWLIDRYPDILPVDREGRIRQFGSRRHYCFSSPSYQRESCRIVQAIASRYGRHPAVSGWQTDNEYGCHDTTRCYCPRCREAFQRWLKARYKTPEALNRAWGTVFWSQEYRSFEEVELPNLTVTNPNPAHLLDYFRFASDQVRAFNRLQVDILRAYSPGRFITHNFMGAFTQFDHFALTEDLDFASWDSYPLGHVEWGRKFYELREYFPHSGHPDIAPLNHDLYRGVGRGRFWVMEQQAGPVQWAPRNLSPAPGMVRLWTWEAFAHGAEVVSYFRWRQAPFAQEQMHTGLLRPDSTPDTGFAEVARVARELASIPLPPLKPSQVALVFDYEAAWVFEIEPLGEGIQYLPLVLSFYSALRRLGLDVDILSPQSTFSGYRLLVIPSLPILSEAVVERLSTFQGAIVFGPRTGSKTSHFQIPRELPPGPLQKLLPLRIVRVESLGTFPEDRVTWKGKQYPVSRWREWVETSLSPQGILQDGKGAIFGDNNRYYLAFWPDDTFLLDFFEELAQKAGITTTRLPEGLRLRRRGDLICAFNYSPENREVPAKETAQFLLGGRILPPYEVAIWRETL
uniref:Beta-galactosidase n=1 Tax=Candidatus Caldatribacterium saccharofermentans TaxID=1454753 RepID=A0A7V4TGC2_9BACT